MATTALQFAQYKLSYRTITRFNIIHNNYPSFHLLQSRHFATRTRPKSIISLSNPNRKRTKESSEDELTPSTNWDNYEIQLFQYYHDPRSSQYRILLDYFNIPYDCIEVTPFKKLELSIFQIPEEHHHAPLLKMANNKKLKEIIDIYKKKAIQYIPNGYRHETMQIANVNTFRDRVKDYINKHQGKSQEEKDTYKQKVDELYEHYDALCLERYNLFFHHDDLYTKFIPMIESNLTNDQYRRFFNDKCEREKIEVYATKYAWTLQACIAKSFHSCFQLMSYIRMMRKLRKWSRFRIETTHLFGGLKMRVFQRRKYCKKAQTGNQPKGQAMKLTYEFLQIFNEDMPDLSQRGKIPKDDDAEDVENTKQDIGLIGKPFHGGRNPDIMDILVYGALRGVQGLDIYHYLFKKTIQIEKWYTKMQDEVGRSSCKKHA